MVAQTQKPIVMIKVLGKINLDNIVIPSNSNRIQYCPKCHTSYSFGMCACELEEELTYLASTQEVELSEEDYWDGDDSVLM